MVKVLTSKGVGEPSFHTLGRAAWQRVKQPMASIRTIRTLRKVDEAKGNTQPEGRNLLMRAGVGKPQQAPRVIGVNEFPAFPGAKTRVSAPSPTNNQGVKRP
jgi:hypothetical protein